MSQSKQYDSVQDLFRANAEPELADEFDRDVARRELARRLAILRMKKGLSQTEVGEHMRCTQGRISKLESSLDDDLRLGDIRDYLHALDYDLMLVISKKKLTLTEQIKWHMCCIRKALGQLVQLSLGDRQMIEAARKFNTDFLFNALVAFGEQVSTIKDALRSAKQLSADQTQRMPPVIELDDDGSEECDNSDKAAVA